MLNRYTLPLMSALVVSASLASCQRKEVASVPELPPAGEIGFTVSDSDAETKSAPLKKDYFGTNHNPFNVVVYKHAEGAATSEWDLFSSGTQTCNYDASYEIWRPSTAIGWPMTEEKLTFIAYAPTSLPSPTTSSGGALKDGEAPFLKDYTVKSNVNEQEDILLATKESSASPLVQDVNVGLEFRHALTFVKFSIGKNTICYYIGLSGIPGTGTLDMNTGEWSPVGTADASYTIWNPTFGSWDSNGQCLIDEAYTLMLIPQTLPEGAILEADTSIGNFTASLAGQVWEPGKVVTYKITDPVPTFTVSSTGDKVRFSPGNLQYQASSGTWRFAEHQWDYVGDASNGNVYGRNRIKSDNASIGESYSGWIDLFGWGTSGHEFWSGYGTAYQPWSTSVTGTDYGPTDGTSGLTGEYALGDWGENVFGWGWHTLSSAEWTYLLNTRTGNRYCKAKVNNVPGLVIFPDEYSHPSGVTAPASVNTGTAAFTSNTWADTDWAKMESAGCVFLPAAGYRDGTSVYNVGFSGSYFSITPRGASDVNNLGITSSYVNPAGRFDRYCGGSVRLVQDLLL